MSNIFASNSEREITKFNGRLSGYLGNSKEFTLGWDVKDNQSFGGYRKKEEFKETGPATRTDRFLDKKQPDMAVKIGAKGTEPPVTTAQTPKITRNVRQQRRRTARRRTGSSATRPPSRRRWRRWSARTRSWTSWARSSTS